MNTDHDASIWPSSSDPYRLETGVLLSDQIEYYAIHHNMIQPFSTDSVRPAGYSLHVGDEFMIAGKLYDFEKQKITDLTIEPYEVAIIKIAEKLCLPRFLIGRWDIKVTLAYKGLMWVGGAQVDPGFKGHLLCPIYNLSNKSVHLKRGSELAVIDFVKTTTFGPQSKKFDTEGKEGRAFHEFEADQLESALVKQVDDIEDVKAKAEAVDNKMTTFTTIIVSLLGLFGVSRFVDEGSLPTIDWSAALIFVLVLLAVVLIKVMSPGIGLMRRTIASLRINPKTLLRMYRWTTYSLVVLTSLVSLGLLYVFVAAPFVDVENRLRKLEQLAQAVEQHPKGAASDGQPDTAP